jgi:hypothetical protein
MTLFRQFLEFQKHHQQAKQQEADQEMINQRTELAIQQRQLESELFKFK